MAALAAASHFTFPLSYSSPFIDAFRAKRPNARVQRGRVRHSDADENCASRPPLQRMVRRGSLDRCLLTRINELVMEFHPLSKTGLSVGQADDTLGRVLSLPIGLSQSSFPLEPDCTDDYTPIRPML